MPSQETIQAWWEGKLNALTPTRRQISKAGVRGFSDGDWEAFYVLHNTYRISERNEDQLEKLGMEEQRILKHSPKVRSFGYEYSAPWSWGVRLRAAARLWGTTVQAL